jgi:diphthamide biosynthesis protein 7
VTRKNDLLVASMHDGFKIVRFNTDKLLDCTDKRTDDSGDWEILKRFDAHKSLAYGVDWSFDSVANDKSAEAETLVASGSFYDHALHLWSG